MLLSTLLSGRLDFSTAVGMILADLVIIFLILPFHEWAHAFAANLLGDKGIKQRGRLTLNPLSHIDPIGALCIILVGFGWARPVEVDPRYFKNPKVGMGITAAAGPTANLVAALVGGFLFHILNNFAPSFILVGFIGALLSTFLVNYIFINVSLAIFNLIPIPPLDGSKILFIFLPDNAVSFFYRYERIFYIVLLALLFTDVLPLSQITMVVSNFIFNITSLPFAFFA